MKTEVDDLTRIYINQIYYEDFKIEGALSQNVVGRKTNYDIYIISETEADEETKKFYNKTFLCSIAISSECVSTNDEYCSPKKLVDLSDQNYSHVKQIRVLEETEDFENFPIPLCFFNLTDNNVITSIACHKNISENRVNSIVLDLYFFRPPGLKRIDKEKANITITSYKEGDKEVIRETNGGICDVENFLGSFCSTDMITKKDSNGNLLTYDEIAFSNITTNEDNFYIKNKTTQLIVDNTEFLNIKDSKRYNETLNILYPNLKNYLKYYVHFSTDDFKELYNITKGIENTNKKNRRRYLLSDENEKPVIIVNEELFNYSHYSGIEISLKLQDNVGYNSEAMEASSFFEIDGEKMNLENLKEFSDIDKAISKLISLSRAGNNLATALYQKINENLNNITEIIRIKIPSMNNLVLYKELTDIFDSTFSFNSLKVIPIDIVEESNNLVKKLDDLYNGINNGSLKNNIRILNNYIYQFIQNSHILVNKISNNLKDLGNLIKAPKQAISYISLYYMNHTSTSYINTIIEAKNILDYYYINEKDLIIPAVNNILQKFEEITTESIQKQINLINNLSERIEDNNLTIIDINDEDYKKIIANLQNSNNYISNIINLFKQKVINEMELKDGYFIKKHDIESNNETFTKIIKESLQIAQNLDDNEYIDKKFDEIMTDFRNEFITIIKYMEEVKEEQFIMDENTLNADIFKPSEQKKISTELKDEGVNIINKILEENNKYLNKTREKVDEFLENNKTKLYEIMSELGKLFSEVNLNIIDNSYEESFDRTLNKLTYNIQQNKDLTSNYFNELVGIMENNNSIIEFLQSIPVDKSLPPGLSCKYPTHKDCKKFDYFSDTIKRKFNTQFYKNKYNIFISKFDSSIEFINNDLSANILQEYKKRINAIKELLQSFKNNKMSDKYPEFSELYFIDNHIKNLDEFYNNLNKYISDDRFNKYYLPKIDNYKKIKKNEIDDFKNYIENQHLKIGPNGTINDFKNDFCVSYTRKRTFTCNNGAHYYYYDDAQNCFESSYKDNYNSLTLPSFSSDTKFNGEFNSFYNSIKNNINSYNSMINSLKKTLTDIESQILNENITLNYLIPIKEKTNSILSEKYYDKLIKSSYDYYKNILNLRLENTLNNTYNKWINSFNVLEEKVKSNLNNFKNSIKEFGLVATIYNSIISQNLTKSYYDSIIKHQKIEFNYTISYYYNCLLQNMTSVYQYIFNQIPTNQIGFNNILDLRKKQVNNSFNDLFRIIRESKDKSLNFNQQTYILEVSPTNFFNMDSILTKIKGEFTTLLSNKANSIFKIIGGKEVTEYSLACRFYLENSLNGWQIENIYQPINENIFVKLNLEEFKEILSSNWIFDIEDFINRINLAIYKINNETISDLMTEKEKYRKILENQITNFYSKESIVSRIHEQYKNEIREITNDMAYNIKQKIQNILSQIKLNLIKEEERIKVNAVSYSKDFETINNTIKGLKDKILSELKNILHKIVKDFTDNMNVKVYKERVESNLNNYLSSAENYSSTCETIDTLKSSFNIGEIIKEIVNDLVIEYKNYTYIQINLTNNEYIDKIEKWAKIDEINNLINNEIDQTFSNLLNTLKNVTVDNLGNDDYDLNNEIRNDINSKFQENMNNIENIVSSIKGKEYNVSQLNWVILDYQDNGPFVEISDNRNFGKFISNKINIEKKELNTFLKQIIRSNFNNLINNLIQSFGVEFFDRILKYNENFKISTLYKDLKYTLVVSLTYYASLNALKEDIKSLTQDLKFKLYSLNNLDLIVDEKNQKVLNLLKTNIDLFIDESQRYLINNYKNFLKEDALIKLIFNESIIESIENNLNEVSSELEKDFISLLNEQFKKKFLNSYTIVMNQQTNDMIQTVNELKQTIRSMINDLFTLDIEKVLDETNIKMNNTIDSIKEYNDYFNSFKIPEELINFLNTYGDNVIQRAYDGIETYINKLTKNITLTNLEKNSKNFENTLKPDEFLAMKNNVYSLIKDENIDNIIKTIDSYGRADYPDNLQNEINKIESRRRRLKVRQTEEDIKEEYNEKVADKSIDENFQKLLNASENAINFVKTFEYFEKFDDMIQNYLKKLKISYKESEQIIDNVYKDDIVYEILNDKLESLNNYSLNYYEVLKSNHDSLRKFIKESLDNIDALLNQCANITYQTFASKYEEISEEIKPIDKSHNDDKKIEPLKKISSSQNTEFTTDADISVVNKKARFKFALITEVEGKIKKPKIVASINNYIKPEEVKLKISKHIGSCGKDYHEIKVNFNNVSYSTNLNFDTKSTLINVTSITDFESYSYSVARYKIENSNENICINFLGISTCLEEECPKNPKTVDPPVEKTIKKFYKEDIISIDG